MKRKNDYHLIMVLLVSLAIIIIFQKLFHSPAANDFRIKRTIEKINQICPMVIDGEIQLENIYLLRDSGIVILTHSLPNTITDSLFILDFEEIIKPIILENVKKNHVFRIFRANNMTFVHIFKDINDEFLSEISISPEKYKQNEENEELEVHFE